MVGYYEELIRKIAQLEPNRYWKADDLHRQLADVIRQCRIAIHGTPLPIKKIEKNKHDGKN